MGFLIFVFFQLFGRMQAHFENIQQIADTTTLPHAMLYLSSRVAEELDIMHLTERLIRGKGQPNTMTTSEKLELWDRLKILSTSLILLFTKKYSTSLAYVVLGYIFVCVFLKFKFYNCVPCAGFTRMVVSLWAMTMLSLYIRVQVNILGRHLYIDTARDLGSSHLPVSSILFFYFSISYMAFSPVHYY